MHSILGLCAELLVQPLQLPLDGIHRVEVEQFPQLGIADELAQLRLIDRQRLRAALGERRIAVVQKARHVAEEQRRGKRRGPLGIHGDHAQRPAADVGRAST